MGNVFKIISIIYISTRWVKILNRQKHIFPENVYVRNFYKKKKTYPVHKGY